MDERNDYNSILLNQSQSWYQAQNKKIKDKLQDAIEEEFSKTHDLIMENLVPKDKGTMRNINNYRMKLWCDSFLIHRAKEEKIYLCALKADMDLVEFDKRFNQ